MPSQRVMYRFSDGGRELRQPATVPELGERLKRRGKEWAVIGVHERGDITIVTLQRTSTDGNRADGHRPR